MSDAEWADTLVIEADHVDHDERSAILLSRSMVFLEGRVAIIGDCVTAFRLRAARLRLLPEKPKFSVAQTLRTHAAMEARDLAADGRNAARFAVAAHERRMP